MEKIAIISTRKGKLQIVVPNLLQNTNPQKSYEVKYEEKKCRRKIQMCEN